MYNSDQVIHINAGTIMQFCLELFKMKDYWPNNFIKAHQATFGAEKLERRHLIVSGSSPRYLWYQTFEMAPTPQQSPGLPDDQGGILQCSASAVCIQQVGYKNSIISVQ